MRSDIIMASLMIWIAAALTAALWAVPAAAISVRPKPARALSVPSDALSIGRFLRISSHSKGSLVFAANITEKTPAPSQRPSATEPDPSRVQSDLTDPLRATIDPFSPSSPVERRRYERAASRFPAFCQNWQRLLHDREVNNLQHLSWSQKNGYETATYVGYGKVQSCECKASEGLPIGKIRYQELDYYLVGKSIRQALHTTPKLLGTISTLEIFSWEKNKWFY